ncbi:hypothetical protein BDV93DRAFT_160505 [Ceratobasidium sp. AG-I]|nr:hypothetical protein BDV93DRAFT_160505 [Ceratobasidium sp. AG-I]
MNSSPIARECKYWAAGRCNQGDECPFKHTYGDDVDHQLESSNSGDMNRENPYWRSKFILISPLPADKQYFPRPRPLFYVGRISRSYKAPRRTARPCKWFQQGQCLRGDNCNYLHTLETSAPVACKFYPTPGCRNGAECPFAHVDGGDQEDDEQWEAQQQWEEQMAIGQGAGKVNGANGNGAHLNGNGNGFGFAGHVEDEDSEDDVIFEPMRSASAQSPGGLSMVRT